MLYRHILILRTCPKNVTMVDSVGGTFGHLDFQRATLRIIIIIIIIILFYIIIFVFLRDPIGTPRDAGIGWGKKGTEGGPRLQP